MGKVLEYVFVPLIVVVLVVLAWTWWASRAGRDPVSSVDSFNRALTAMRPPTSGGSPDLAPRADAATDPGLPSASN